MRKADAVRRWLRRLVLTFLAPFAAIKARPQYTELVRYEDKLAWELGYCVGVTGFWSIENPYAVNAPRSEVWEYGHDSGWLVWTHVVQNAEMSNERQNGEPK